MNFRDLPHHRAHRAAGRGHHHGFAGLGLADVQQAHVAGEAGHAQHAQRIGRMLGIGPQAHQARAVGYGVVLPAGLRQHPFAGLVLRMIGDLDPRDGAAHHGLADLNGLGIGRGVAHAAAHIGIQGQIDRAQQHLAWAGLRHFARFQAEIAVGGLAVRARGKHDTAVDQRRLRHDVQPPSGSRPGLAGNTRVALWEPTHYTIDAPAPQVVTLMVAPLLIN
ncbi:hypothetical protein D3C85_1271940 [compost metagenome]